MFRNKSTIKDVIEQGLESKMTIKDLSFREVITNSAGEKFVINMYNLFEKYYDILLDYTVVAVLDEEDYRKYRLQPKLLAKDLYANQDLYYLLLRLNHVYSIIQFDFKEVRIFKPEIKSLLNEIIVMESEEYIDNEMSVLKKINE